MPKRTDLESLKRLLAARKPELQARYNLVALGVFGSFVRGEQHEESDVDVLIDYESTARLTMFDIVELENELSELLGMPVDIVTKPALKPHIGKQILQEVEYV